MFKKIFFDANMLIDVFDAKRKAHRASTALYKSLYAQNVTLLTSCDIITTIYYITAKQTALEKALEAIEIVNDTIEVISFGGDEVAETIRLMKEDSDYKDFEDTLQYVLALRHGAEAIITNDRNFVSKNLPVYTAKAFMTKYF